MVPAIVVPPWIPLPVRPYVEVSLFGANSIPSTISYRANGIRQVTSRQLLCPFVYHTFNLGRGEADGGHAFEDTADGRDGSIFAYYVLKEQLSKGAVRVDGCLQRHDGFVGGHSIGHFGSNLEETPQRSSAPKRRAVLTAIYLNPQAPPSSISY
jgi:hypothetical protein